MEDLNQLLCEAVDNGDSTLENLNQSLSAVVDSNGDPIMENLNQTLCTVVYNGDSILLKELLEKFCTANAKKEIQIHKLLFIAVKKGHHYCVKVLLDFCSIKEIVARCYYEGNVVPCTPMSYAASHGNWRIVELFIDYYAVASSARKTCFPLHKACNSGETRCVKILLNKFPHHNHVMDRWGYFPIHYAALHCGFNVIKALIKAGADVNAVRACDGATSLHLVCQIGGLDEINLILSRTTEINVQDKQGLTPLHVAAGNGHADVVTLLLANGANPAVLSSGNHVLRVQSSLAIAAANGNLEIVKLLADMTPREFRPEAIVKAINGRWNDCLQYLLSKGSSPPLSEFSMGGMFNAVGSHDDITKTLEILLENGLPISELARSHMCLTPHKFYHLQFDNLKVFLDFGWLESFGMKTNEGFLAELLFMAGVFLYKMINVNMQQEDSYNSESESDEDDSDDGESMETKMNIIFSKFLLLQNYYPFIKFFHYNPSSPKDIISTDDYIQKRPVPNLSEICRWRIRCQIISKYGMVSHEHVQKLSLPRPLKVLIIPDKVQ